MGQPHTYEKLQREPSQRILDDRPTPDDDMPPISLLYDGFGSFLDITNGRNNVPGMADVNVPELQAAVDELANAMIEYYENENARRENENARRDAAASFRPVAAPRSLNFILLPSAVS